MNKEIKQKWIEALRSSDYQQTTGKLKVIEQHDDDQPSGFCCLGVLVDVAGIGAWNEEWVEDYIWPVEDLEDGITETIFDGELDEHALDYFGIEQEEATKLINMNDEERKNFNEIADWIEANL